MAKETLKHESQANLPLLRNNFLIMIAAVVLIVVGFILMAGGGSDNPAEFNPSIFSTVRIVIGPMLAFLGFVLMAVGIIVKPKAR